LSGSKITKNAPRGNRRGNKLQIWVPAMELTPKDMAGLIVALMGQPDERKVEADEDTGVTEKTVAKLRARTTWPGGLRVTTPRENYPEAVVRISVAN
jgi:hypothetical protein